MSNLDTFRKTIRQYYRQKYKADGRKYTQLDLAQKLNLHEDELGKRLHGYRDEKTGRVWHLTEENVLDIVLTLAEWEALTWEEAVNLLSLMDYPLDQFHWKTKLQRHLISPARSVSPVHADRQKSKERRRSINFGIDEVLSYRDQIELLGNPDPHYILDTHLENFVIGTRQTELMKVDERIKALRSYGGYLLLTGRPGEGKTTLIARLIRSTFSSEKPAYYIIPLTQGHDYQITVLRCLMATLTLKYDYLSDVWVKIYDGNALVSIFSEMLQEIADQGHQEVIFIDGLDQIKQEKQEIYFLPNRLPKGIVIIIGTRSDIIPQLVSRVPCETYELPSLSREDFKRLLAHRKVQLDDIFVDHFYEKMHQNILYLDLIAKELMRGDAAEPDEIIRRIGNNPNNIYTFSIDRLKRYENEWNRITRPVMSILLAAREPLTATSIQRILNREGSRLNDGLQRLNGFVVKDAEGRYDLYHLKFRDYLRQDIFTLIDEKKSHEYLANWCEKNGHLGLADIWDRSDGIAEQEWRQYARQYYVAHLYQAEAWTRLWMILDSVEYGKAKIEYDLSTQLYAQDIQLGRLAAARKDWGLKDGIAMLPRLWKYSLLLHTLSSRADRYPDDAFETLVLLGQKQEAIGLAELLTKPIRKVIVQTRLAQLLYEREGPSADVRGLLIRAADAALSLQLNTEKAQIVRVIAEALIKIGEEKRAMRLLLEVEKESKSSPTEEKAWILCELAIAQYKTHEKATAKRWVSETKKQISTLENKSKQNLLSKVVSSLIAIGEFVQAESLLAEITDPSSEEVKVAIRELAETQQWDNAQQMVGSMKDDWDKVAALRNIANRLIAAGKKEQARDLLHDAERIIRSIYSPKSIDFIAHLISYAVSGISQAGLESYVIALGELSADMKDVGEEKLSDALLIEALTSAREMGTVEAMANVVVALIKVKDWQKAKQLFAEIKQLVQSGTRIGRYDSDRFVIWSKIALALVRAEDKISAERLLREIKQWALADVPVTNMRVKNFEDFPARLKDAKDFSLMHLAIANAIAGNFDEAEKALSLMSKDDDALVSYAVAAQRVAQEFTVKNDIERIIRFFRDNMFLKNLEKAEILCESAKTLAESGTQTSAVTLLEIAEAAFQEVSGQLQGEEQEFISNIIEVWCKIGAWERAEALTRNCEGDIRTIAQSTLAIFLKKAGRKRKALRLLVDARRSFRSMDGIAATALTSALIEFGLWDKAEKLAQLSRSRRSEMPPNFDALKDIAIGLIKIGNWQRFETVLKNASGYYNRNALIDISISLAKVGAWKKCEDYVLSLKNDDDIVMVFSRIAQELVESGQQERALHFIEAAENKLQTFEQKQQNNISISSETLSTLSVALAKVRQWDKAEKLVWSISDFTDRCLALHELAHRMVVLGEPLQSLQLIQRSWLQSETRLFLTALLPMATSLIVNRSEIAKEFDKAVDWVDAFSRSM